MQPSSATRLLRANHPTRRGNPFTNIVRSALLASLWVAWATPTALQGTEPKSLAGSGIRTLASEHLTLHTDLPSQPAVDELPHVFDLAIPEWAEFFDVKPQRLRDWHVEASLIQNPDRFRQYGLLPDDLPPFLNGMQIVDQLWVYEQPSDYYRRHLLLHEGTHSVMNRIYGNVGPVWYREGLAEFVATHQYENGTLRLAHMPKDKKDVAYWGRIRIVKDQLGEGTTRSIPSIVAGQARDYLLVESYAWSWALQAFGQGHPVYGELFSRLQKDMPRPDDQLTQHFLRSYRRDRDEIDAAWHLFLHQLDYGYDPRCEVITRVKPVRPLEKVGATVVVDVTKGWQSTGITLPASAEVEVTASGRFQLADAPQPWWSEPQGVTIEYYQGRPLGILLAAVVGNSPTGAEAFTQPIPVGTQANITTTAAGVLYLRINERADRLGDNQGTIAVRLIPRADGL